MRAALVILKRGGILADWIGRRLGDLTIRHRPRRVPAADATSPVPVEHARLLVAAAIRQHNAGLVGGAVG